MTSLEVSRFLVMRNILKWLTGHEFLVNLSPRARHKSKKETYATVITPINDKCMFRRT